MTSGTNPARRPPPAPADRFTSFGRRYPNEIIEFPCQLLRWTKVTRTSSAPNASREAEGSSSSSSDDEGGSSGSSDGGEDERVEWRLETVDEFHSFVKPTWKPKLSAFCTELTGISQVSTAGHGGVPFAPFVG